MTADGEALVSTLVPADEVLPAAALDAATSDRPLPQDGDGHVWSPMLRFGFRLAFCYLGTYCLCDGNANVWEALPVIGEYPSEWLANLFRLPAQYVAQHLFHLQGVAAHLHPTGSGDTAIRWITMGIMVLVSVIAALVWTALDARRPNYQTLSAWLRFLIRLTLGMGMVVYGLSKVFPLQMPPPSLAVLNEPLGQSSPMTLLWTMLALNPVYEVICGGAELLAGLLILFRRTALAGALLTGFVMVNVLLYNLFFDVPVKIYAAHLVLLATFVVLPDVKALYEFFWLHKPSAPTGVWVPPASRKGFRRATVGVEIGFAVLAIGGLLIGLAPAWLHQHNALLHPSPLAGAWHIDSAMLTDDKGVTSVHPVLTGDGAAATTIFYEPSSRTMVRDTEGVLWRSGFEEDMAKHTADLRIALNDRITYTLAQPDADHMILTPNAKDAHKVATLTLSRIPLPSHYPIQERGFHLVNEWGLER